MFIDYSTNKISIEYKKQEFLSHHKSQLSFWGFKPNLDNTRSLFEGDSELLFSKLLIYLEKNNLFFELSDTSLALVSRLEESKREYESLLCLGRNIKEGKINKSAFNEYIAFLNTLPRKLKEHQMKASFHLYSVMNGANFSVPGAGKTSVVLSVFEKLKSEKKVNTLLVFGPPACFGPWKKEYYLTLGKEPKVNIFPELAKFEREKHYYYPNGVADLNLITFNTALNDKEHILFFLSDPGVDAYVIIDEAHYIKRLDGQWANAILGIAEAAKYRCVLTGTPIPNHYRDVYNLFDFLWPDKTPINAERKIQIQLLEEKQDHAKASQILQTCIEPLFYRVRKKDLGLKPQNFNKPYLIEMNKYEKILYDSIKKSIIDLTQEDYLKNIDLLKQLKRGRMIRLRQCVSYASLLSTAIENYSESLIEDSSDLTYLIEKYDVLEIPAKITFLVQLVNEFVSQNKKVVIWSNFIGTICKIEIILAENQVLSKKIIGATPTASGTVEEEETREKIIERFVSKDSGLNVLIANPAACAESISLHKTCHDAIYYDLSYNCAQYLQSLDRIHRVGGSEFVEANYHFLQYRDTVEQVIHSRLLDKAERMYEIIENDYAIYSLDMQNEDDELYEIDELIG